MFVSVGSASNVGEGNEKARRRGDRAVGGGAWPGERPGATRPTARRVLVFDPEGGNRRVCRQRGCATAWGSPVHPQSGDLWCSTNERDALGDDLVPDFMTRVRDGAFYGWPWYYLGANEDPRHPRRAAGPQGQGHRARRADPGAFRLDGDGRLRRRPVPSEYAGDAFAAQHGSWNRASALATKWCACGSRTASRTANTRTS